MAESRYLVHVALTLLSAAFCTPGGNSAPKTSSSKILSNVHHYAQDMPYWCWAASAEMIMENKGVPVPQNQQAFDEFHNDDCKTPYLTCDLPGTPVFEYYQFSYRTTVDSALPWPDVVSQIDSDKPFAFSRHTPKVPGQQAAGHMMVVIGYYADSVGQEVVYNEPLYNGDSFLIPYQQYVGAKGEHAGDFYDVTLHQSNDTKH